MKMKKQLAGFIWLAAIMVLFVLSGHNKEEFQVQAIESDNNHTEIVNSVQGMINLTGK